MILILFLYMIIINLFSLLIFYIDKRKSIKRKWRISEFNLFLTAIIGGGLGAFLGMMLFRHKTKHLSFVIGIPAILLLNAIIYANLFIFIRNFIR